MIDGIRVYDVQEKGEQIFHYLEGELEEGKDRDRSDRLGQTFFTDCTAQRRTYRIGNRFMHVLDMIMWASIWEAM